MIYFSNSWFWFWKRLSYMVRAVTERCRNVGEGNGLLQLVLLCSRREGEWASKAELCWNGPFCCVPFHFFVILSLSVLPCLRNWDPANISHCEELKWLPKAFKSLLFHLTSVKCRHHYTYFTNEAKTRSQKLICPDLYSEDTQLLVQWSFCLPTPTVLASVSQDHLKQSVFGGIQETGHFFFFNFWA